jgi:hypothetical protein
VFGSCEPTRIKRREFTARFTGYSRNRPKSWEVALPYKWFGPVSTSPAFNQDPAREITGLEYLFANKKDFGGDDNARQKLGSVLI